MGHDHSRIQGCTQFNNILLRNEIKPRFIHYTYILRGVELLNDQQSSLFNPNSCVIQFVISCFSLKNSIRL